MEKRKTLTLKSKNASEAEAPKSTQAKTPQEAPQEAKVKSHAHVNAKKKQHRIDRIAKYWPLFGEPEAKPLMIGIADVMKADAVARGLDIPEGQIKQGLHSYVNRKTYLRAIISGGQRFNMNGHHEGEVTPEQQVVAERKLNDWQAAKS